MQDVWKRLGIEATEDVIAIKRAYASALKRNRPDDDPQAYQQLRQDYEDALALARNGRPPISRRTRFQPHEIPIESAPLSEPLASPESSAETPILNAVVTPFETETASENTEQPFDDGMGNPLVSTLTPERIQHALEVDPADLAQDGLDMVIDIDELLHTLSASISAGRDWAATWEHLAATLAQLPLRMQQDAATRFADFVLNQEQLPDSLVQKLADHFLWSDDYRTTSAMGTERASALHLRILAIEESRINREIAIRENQDILRLGWLLHHSKTLHAMLFLWLFAPWDIERRTLKLREAGYQIPWASWDDISKFCGKKIEGMIWVIAPIGLGMGFLKSAHPSVQISEYLLPVVSFFAAWLGYVVLVTVLQKIIVKDKDKADAMPLRALWPLGLIFIGAAGPFTSMVTSVPLALLAALATVRTWPGDRLHAAVMALMTLGLALCLYQDGFASERFSAALVCWALATTWINLGNWLFDSKHVACSRLLPANWAIFSRSSRPLRSKLLLILGSPLWIVAAIAVQLAALPFVLRETAIGKEISLVALGPAAALTLSLQVGSHYHTVTFLSGLLVWLWGLEWISRRICKDLPAQLGFEP